MRSKPNREFNSQLEVLEPEQIKAVAGGNFDASSDFDLHLNPIAAAKILPRVNPGMLAAIKSY